MAPGALLDQAVHARLRHVHARLRPFPKLGGILATFHSNLHPALLLLAATDLVPPEAEPEPTEDLRTLATHCFGGVYPRLVGLAATEDDAMALSTLADELSTALALLFVPKSLRPYSPRNGNRELYERWLVMVHHELLGTPWAPK